MIGDTVKIVAPEDIERLSFTMIQDEFFAQTGIEPETIDEGRFKIIRRVIHATGDFSFARTLIFHDRAINAGIGAIRAGRKVVIDVTMGAAGINRSLLGKFGGEVRCCINDPGVTEQARRTGKTRSETALRQAIADNPGIIAIGNAPTALLATMDMIDRRELAPALVIGVPVGFVNALESKELLIKQRYPFIANQGRKGGSSVAVAIVNALLRLAESEERQ